ncbi:MAG: hypothetical protein ACTJHU_01470, partial [Mycetocola sp.]
MSAGRQSTNARLSRTSASSLGRRARYLIAGGLLGALALTGCTPGADEQPVPTPSGVDLTQINPDDPDGNGLWYLRDADLTHFRKDSPTAG